MLNPDIAHKYNIILSIFLGLFIVILIYIYTYKYRIIIIEKN